MDTVQKTAAGSQQRILEFDLASELHHGMLVSNLAYAVAEEMGLPHEQCYELAIAGMLHDIGKLKLTSYINGQEQDPLVIEELKYVRMHSTLGYEELKGFDISSVMELMIDEVKNFDMQVFLAFQRVVHNGDGQNFYKRGGQHGIKEETGNRYEGHFTKRDGNP